MRVKIAHETSYAYGLPARNILQILRLTPPTHEGQRVIRWRIEPSVEGRLQAGRDHFGNHVHVFSADDPLRQVTMAVEGEVETEDSAGVVRGVADALPEECWLRVTALTEPSEEIRRFADDLASGDGTEPLPVLHRLMGELNRTIAFDTSRTSTDTTAADAFALKRGVCQDLTHVFIASARHLGVPTRYVSGYFRRGDGVLEQEAGHAWAEARVPGLGWIGFDPTNGICVTDAHVRVAVALDYLGASPIRGSRRGGGEERMTVRLRVEGSGETAAQGQMQAQT